MLLSTSISKIKELIFILALAAVALLCVVAFHVSETDAEGECSSCGQDSNARYTLP